MRILFAGGGTGGHINPALSIADYIKEREQDFDALFIGTEHGLEKRLVPQAGYEIRYIDIQGFDRKRLWKNVSVLKKLISARMECRSIIEQFKPDFVVCTGGYVSGPVAMAAGRLGIPSIIHEQNVYPGLTVRGAEKYVTKVAVSFEETKSHMKNPKKCVLTGNPVRKEIFTQNRNTARSTLKLAAKPFVLVFGGSLGAQRINETMTGVLKKISEDAPFTILFATGERSYKAVKTALDNAGIVENEALHVVPYIDNMPTVMAAADLVVARSGAITVSEIAALGKASILIPSPNVVRNHQEQNAREFEKNGAAEVLTEDILTPDSLYERITTLVNAPERLAQMEKNVKKLARPNALEDIYELLLEIKK